MCRGCGWRRYASHAPIIVIAGMFYMTVKHMVDKYNMFFVRQPQCQRGHTVSNTGAFKKSALAFYIISIFIFQAATPGWFQQQADVRAPTPSPQAPVA